MLQAHWGANPVVIDRLVGLDDDTVTLSGVDIQEVNSKWVVVDTINFDDREAVTGDGECKEAVSRGIDEAESVAKSLLNIDPGPRGSWTTNETTFAVDGTTVRDWLVATTVIVAKELIIELDCRCMVPVCQDNNGVGVVNVIEAKVGVHRIVDNQRSTETVDILRRKMGVVLEII